MQLGDLICTGPALRALRAAAPDARITLIGLPWAASFQRRFRACLDDFIEFPGWPGIAERESEPQRLIAFDEQVHAARFSTVTQMHGDGSLMNEFAASIPADMHAGFVPAESPEGSPHTLPYDHELPEPVRLLRLVEHLGASSQGTDLHFPLFDDERMDAALLLATAGIEDPYVCVHPGSAGVDRRWPPERFAAVASALTAAGYHVVLTGTEGEREITQAVLRATSGRVSDLTGMTSLGTLGAILLGARLLVSNDTGVSHVAAALRVPSVIVFTGSERSRWAPLNAERHIAIGEGLGRTSDRLVPGRPPDAPAVMEAAFQQLRLTERAPRTPQSTQVALELSR